MTGMILYSQRWFAFAHACFVVTAGCVLMGMPAVHAQPIAVATEQVLSSPVPQAVGRFGVGVAGVPDLTGDGLGDVLVGALLEDTPASDAGRAYVFDGATGQLLHELQSPQPAANGLFGYAVRGLGDVTGDGLGDLVVGARGEPAAIAEGRVYVFDGATGQLVRTLVSPAPQASGFFGNSLGIVPDMDGDGMPEIAVGANEENAVGSPAGAGRVHVFSGATAGLLMSLQAPDERAGAWFGTSVDGVANVDGSGRGGVVVGAMFGGSQEPPEGRAYVFSHTGALLYALSSPELTGGGHFGVSVSGVPDADGDGRGDILVGARLERASGAPEFAGRAFIFSGATGSLLHALESPEPFMFGDFGYYVTGLSDVDGDGLGDVAVGAFQESQDGTLLPLAGRVHVYSGASGALLLTLDSPDPQADGRFGVRLLGVPGNASGGGVGLVVGAWHERPGASAPLEAGRAWVFRFAGATAIRHGLWMEMGDARARP